MATSKILLGPIPHARYDWVSGANYGKEAIVFHKGSSYIALSDNPSTEPSFTYDPATGSYNVSAGWGLLAVGAEIVQETGDSQDKAMSQKAVTDALTASDQKLSELEQKTDTLIPQVDENTQAIKAIAVSGGASVASAVIFDNGENAQSRLGDRAADETQMGYIVLRKGVPFAEQVTQANTIYEIRYDFGLDGESVDVPYGSIIKFNGGSVNNGTLNIGTDVRVLGNGEKMTELFITHSKEVSNIVIDGLEFYGRLTNSATSTSSDLTCCIKSLNYKRANNVRIVNCIIHNYNAGIKITGDNVTIADNLLYGNGALNTPSGVHDGEVDIEFVGQFNTEVDYKNTIISHNRCLSQYVHRNIDVGENYWFNNIVIDGNICVSCDNSFNEVVKARKSQCIFVGYTGTSNTEKQVIITNNICKNCNWGAIYVRADNDAEEGSDSRLYVALITNNIVENVYRATTGHICGGILVETKQGTEIANNYVSNIYDEISDTPVTYAINVGKAHSYGHTYVHDNFIKNYVFGIVNESYSKRIDICRNRLINGKSGIIVNETLQAQLVAPVVGYVINIDGNYLRENSKHSINLDNNYGYSIFVTNNIVFGNGKEGSGVSNIGVYLRGRFQNIFPIYVEHNKFVNLYTGVYCFASTFDRNDSTKTFINYNRYQSCGLALYVGVNSAYQLFVTEGNIYEDCDSKFGVQTWSRCVYDGKINPDGTYTIFDDGGRGDITNSAYGYITNAPVCFYDKLFKKGDRIITSDSRFFDEAICSADYVSHSDNGALWRMIGGRLSTKQSAISALKGSSIYDTTLNKMKLYNGTTWVNLDGTPLE